MATSLIKKTDIFSDGRRQSTLLCQLLCLDIARQDEQGARGMCCTDAARPRAQKMPSDWWSTRAPREKKRRVRRNYAFVFAINLNYRSAHRSSSFEC